MLGHEFRLTKKEREEKKELQKKREEDKNKLLFDWSEDENEEAEEYKKIQVETYELCMTKKCNY